MKWKILKNNRTLAFYDLLKKENKLNDTKAKDMINLQQKNNDLMSAYIADNLTTDIQEKQKQQKKHMESEKNNPMKNGTSAINITETKDGNLISLKDNNITIGAGNDGHMYIKTKDGTFKKVNKELGAKYLGKTQDAINKQTIQCINKYGNTDCLNNIKDLISNLGNFSGFKNIQDYIDTTNNALNNMIDAKKH